MGTVGDEIATAEREVWTAWERAVETGDLPAPPEGRSSIALQLRRDGTLRIDGRSWESGSSSTDGIFVVDCPDPSPAIDALAEALVRLRTVASEDPRHSFHVGRDWQRAADGSLTREPRAHTRRWRAQRLRSPAPDASTWHLRQLHGAPVAGLDPVSAADPAELLSRSELERRLTDDEFQVGSGRRRVHYRRREVGVLPLTTGRLTVIPSSPQPSRRPAGVPLLPGEWSVSAWTLRGLRGAAVAVVLRRGPSPLPAPTSWAVLVDPRHPRSRSPWQLTRPSDPGMDVLLADASLLDTLHAVRRGPTTHLRRVVDHLERLDERTRASLRPPGDLPVGPDHATPSPPFVHWPGGLDDETAIYVAPDEDGSPHAVVVA